MAPSATAPLPAAQSDPSSVPVAAIRPPGLGATLRTALVAGGLIGFLLGIIDGVIAARIGPSVGMLPLIGCIAGATLIYGLIWTPAVLLAGLPVHWLLRAYPLVIRRTALMGFGLGAGIFLEIYWWTRVYVFYGIPATDPKRLAAAAAMLAVGLAVGFGLARTFARFSERAGRALVFGQVATWVLGAIFLFSEWRVVEHNQRGAINERNRDLPNVLLIVVDALRSDVIGAYGNERVQTPNIDALAAGGVLFENAFVQAPFTWSSFGSILTGKYPRRHGLVAMDPTLRMKRDLNVTLPWHLKQAKLENGHKLQDGDYAGAAFMTGTLSHGSGLIHGFDSYFEALVGHELVHLDSRWSVFRSNLLIYLVKNKLTQRFDNSLVTQTAVDWLANRPDRRFVAMLHLYSTHTPYDSPKEFRDMYVDAEYDGPFSSFYAHHRIALESGVYAPTPQDIDQISNLYYAGTSQADRDVGIVLAELERQGVLDDTLVIFTSDHGEELYDHGLWEHNWMYQTNLRIPLIMAWPRRLPAGRRIDALVDTIDILPTTCDLVRAHLPEAEGRDAEYERVDGTSLLPLIRREKEAVREFSFAENGLFLSIQDRGFKLIVRAEALASGGWEGVVSGEIEEPRLYDLTNDPNETLNLFEADSEEALRLFEALLAYDERMPIPRAEIHRSHRERESVELLKRLGYSGTVGQAPQ